jgi:hypothetical protein
MADSDAAILTHHPDQQISDEAYPSTSWNSWVLGLAMGIPPQEWV